MARTYGHIKNVSIGQNFDSRVALSKARVHGPTVAGIWGSQTGAESIVLNEGYVDDEDFGNEIIYTGQGGNDTNTKKQIADQALERGNLGLAISCDKGNPVRVSRGSKLKSPYKCSAGYRYDGLYLVDSYWRSSGSDGYQIYRFRLLAIPNECHFGSDTKTQLKSSQSEGNQAPERVATSILRIARDTKLSKSVKDWHDNTCQACETRIELPGSAYSEAAHVHPLGRPHNGPDTADNILCLCPNCHVMFDRGAIWLDENHMWQPDGKSLLRDDVNPLNPNHAKYHREHFGEELW